ncbi:NmrA-like family protein [Colletotrichum truncatum]|uniref:NmrA-like family protein n=1 Tax=Colletotrichum truncatum TaxID=5467 RepID=A0ACC3YE24_COLTU|nr:NmrA-like family protein [Colletotrichum truncatum]KAF6790250.1 NmrA-like family protein [Colletotrichum truncatum]
MVVVAVAGGTGDLGKAIVEALVHDGTHQVFVLTRKSATSPEVAGAQKLAINYNDIEETANALSSHAIDTIVSTLSVMGPSEQAQLDLIAAASRSSSTKRFIPSEWAGSLPDSTDEETASFMTLPLLRARRALAKTHLETTRVAIGLFMDYWGQPHIPSTLRPFSWGIDIASHRAVIPGTGNEQFTVTYSKDVARFAVKLVSDKNKWLIDSNISGSDTCLNEVLSLAERITGKKFSVHYDSVEDIRAGKATPLKNAPGYGVEDPAEEAAVMGAMALDGGFLIPQENRLNILYPDIEPVTIDHLLAVAWGNQP